jgi:hypothetical protein
MRAAPRLRRDEHRDEEIKKAAAAARISTGLHPTIV